MMILATGFALLLAAAQGEVFVAAGDTLVISGTAVRLRGLDVPKTSPDASEAAKRQLQALVQDSFVSCRLSGEELSHHKLGTCFADGTDIVATLIKGGSALDCERYSNGEYRAFEPDGLRDRLTPSQHCAQ